MNDFEKMMKDLQETYLASIDQKIQHLQTAFQSGNNLEIRETFHKLKGTGTTYGVPEITKLGGLIESLCVKRPADYETYVPASLVLLKAIQKERNSGRELVLDENAQFQTLSKMLSAHPAKV